MCVLRQDRQRGKHEVRWRGAAVYGVLVLVCSSSARTASETIPSKRQVKKCEADRNSSRRSSVMKKIDYFSCMKIYSYFKSYEHALDLVQKYVKFILLELFVQV